MNHLSTVQTNHYFRIIDISIIGFCLFETLQQFMNQSRIKTSLEDSRASNLVNFVEHVGHVVHEVHVVHVVHVVHEACLVKGLINFKPLVQL